jgi:plasmid stabilization system protein ParE
MIYRVIVTPEAEENIAESFAYIERRSPLNAARWLRGIFKVIHTLEHFPRRCAIARETQYLGQQLRHYIYKSHRIIFRIEEKEQIVRVMHIRHAARRAIGESELPADE